MNHGGSRTLVPSQRPSHRSAWLPTPGDFTLHRIRAFQGERDGRALAAQAETPQIIVS